MWQRRNASVPAIVTRPEIVDRSRARLDSQKIPKNCKPLSRDRCHREAQAYNARVADPGTLLA
jgi:hypothetical protein